MIPSPIPRSQSDHTLRRDDPRNSTSAESESNALRNIAGSTSNLNSSPSQSRRNDGSNIPRTAGSARSLVDTDPIAAIRALRSRIRQESSSHTLEMSALETELAAERERKRAEREAARKMPSSPTPSAMLMLRRANTTASPTGPVANASTTTTSNQSQYANMDSPAGKAATMTLYDEQLRKLRQWQNDSKERVRQRETERDAEREKFRALRRGGDTRLKRRSMGRVTPQRHRPRNKHTFPPAFSLRIPLLTPHSEDHGLLVPTPSIAINSEIALGTERIAFVGRSGPSSLTLRRNSLFRKAAPRALLSTAPCPFANTFAFLSFPAKTG
ncbi:hypothetical protein BDZ88DRAFT_442073 [Geranomyces variabilis]|nr:hypothetical protein BDZ88DRAFT_442073 [Geranomyces variabilis]